MAVPGVAMHQIGIDICRIKISAPAHGAENGLQWLGTREIACVELETFDLQISFLEMLIAEATDFHQHRLRQFARKVIDVNASAAVNMRRIFVREKEDFHLRLY
jgi:hypothetical protein